MWDNQLCEIMPIYSISVQDLVYQLQRFLECMTTFHNECETELNKANVFPIEVDLCGGVLSSTFESKWAVEMCQIWRMVEMHMMLIARYYEN